jgi:ornithine cyclodeaminase/alanine dehydrogenase-like protein (mu-crystallin family)
MPAPHRFLYLSRADVETVDLPLSAVIEAVELTFREKANGRTILPAKHWIAPSARRFFSAMSSALPGVGMAGCKWQSGSPDNYEIGQPYITGQFILNSLETGLPFAIMDSTWITEMRTAAATAVAARSLVSKPPKTMAVLGCGLQGRRNLEALRVVFPDITAVRAYDITAKAAEKYRADATAQHGVAVVVCSSPHEAFSGADVVVTCGPIVPDAGRAAEASWLDEGAICVTLDYDCYWKPGELAKVDGLFTDDIKQLEHAMPDGYFTTVPPSVREIAGVVAGMDKGRTSAKERIVCINMGLALEDTATAAPIYQRAREKGVGIELPI